MKSRALKRLAARCTTLLLCTLLSIPTFALAAAGRNGSPAKRLRTGQHDVQTQPTVAATGTASATEASGTAQNGNPAAPQAPAPTQLDRASYQPSAQRVGVDLNQQLTISLHDTIVMALDKNLDIAVQRYNVKQAEYDVLGSRGVYDITPGASLRESSNTQPSTNLFGGAGSKGSTSTRTYTWNLNVVQNLPTGGNYRVDWNNSRNSTTSTATTLNPQFNSSFNVNATQPVLRNFRIDQNQRQIQIAKKQLDISDLQFRQRAIDTINSVQKSYWDLVFAIQNEQIRRDALDLAATQLDNNKKRVAAGDLAPIDITSAEAALEARKQDVISALQQVTTSENILKGLILDDPNSPLWGSVLSPVDKADMVPSGYTLDDAIKVALMNRTDLQNLKSQIQLNEIDLRFFRNQMKPQVDIVGQFGGTGASGSPSGQTFSGPGGTTTVPPFLVGGVGKALSNVYGFDFKTYSFGINFSFPVQNRTARAQLGRTLAQSRILDLQQKRMVQQILVDVRNAVQAVESARQRIEAARSGRVNAEVQLKGEEEKYRAGLSSTFFVLQRQTDLSQARGSELQALTDYNKAIADLQRAMSTTLDSAGVTVTHDVVTQQAPNEVKKP